jgi:hypothetical protein
LKTRKITEVDGGYILTTYQSAVPGKYKKHEKFIPKKSTKLKESVNFGWAHKTANGNVWNTTWHYFQKNDLISLCGKIKLISNKGYKFSLPQGFWEKNKCKNCYNIITTYTDLNNFSHKKDATVKGEW